MRIKTVSAELFDLDRTRLTLTLKSPLTIVTRADEPAIEIARALEAPEMKGGLAVVVTPSGRPTRIFNPPIVLHQLQTVKGIRTNKLSRALQILSEDPSEAGDFEYEWLTQHRVSPHWCEVGQHFVPRRPCSRHR